MKGNQTDHKLINKERKRKKNLTQKEKKTDKKKLI